MRLRGGVLEKEGRRGIRASEGSVPLKDDGLMAAPAGLPGGVIPPN